MLAGIEEQRSYDFTDKNCHPLSTYLSKEILHTEIVYTVFKTGDGHRYVSSSSFLKNVTEISIDKKRRFAYIFSPIEGIAS